jgi:hypothetical protein
MLKGSSRYTSVASSFLKYNSVDHLDIWGLFWFFFFFFFCTRKIMKDTTENYEGKTKIEISRLDRNDEICRTYFVLFWSAKGVLTKLFLEYSKPKCYFRLSLSRENCTKEVGRRGEISYYYVYAYDQIIIFIIILDTYNSLKSFDSKLTRYKWRYCR